jgi:adenylylsulfate kinase
MKQGWAIWITGLPASGKTTVTKHLVEKLTKQKINAQVLESDELRKVLTPNPTYSQQERDKFYNSVVQMGTQLANNDVNVIFDATANKRKWRNQARENIKNFIEVYVDTPLKICRERDPKNIYNKAEKGENNTVPGLQAEYEEPVDPEVKVDGCSDPSTSAEKILKAMKEKKLIP